MKQSTFVGLVAASLTLTPVAALHAQQMNYVETGRDFRQAERVTMGGDLLTPEEQQRFAEQRASAKSREDIDRIEAEERALLNQRVAERVAAALNQPRTDGTQQAPSTAQSPLHPAPRSMPNDSGASEGSMGR